MQLFEDYLNEMAHGTGKDAKVVDVDEFMSKIDEYVEECAKSDIDPEIRFTSVTNPTQKSQVEAKRFPKGELFKISKMEANFGYTYRRKADEMGIAEPTTRRPSPYEPISKAFLKHRTSGQIYLYLLPKTMEDSENDSTTSRFEASKYFYKDEDGFHPVQKSEIEPFLREQPLPRTPIRVTNYKIENIVGVEIDGVDYLIRPMYNRYEELLKDHLERV